MALRNLFDMVKADRYTADGREALIKAQEAETEDARRTYQIGEISEATGLQKTAQGWKPPKETKFGKVKQNKEGQWGVQTKQGKGSDFLKHKSEKEASRALANYTAGYNTTERSKQDPHSDQARQVKQWNKETEKIKKGTRAERRAEHAAQFQNQPTLSQTDGKGNKVEIKITESKGGGFYVDKYVNGKKVGINNANTRESAEAKAKSMMEQHMADPDYKAEEKPAAPKREAVSAGRMMKDLDGNFWSRPEDFKEDITSRGWDVDEMTNEYAVISNEAGSQYEVRFDDHSDDGDLTVRNFKALQIDEDDDDDSLEDAAPSLSEIVDRVYNIGEISEKTGLQKTANGWVKPKNGKQPGAKKPAGNHPPKVMPEGMNPAEFMKAWEDDAKKNGFKKGQGNEWREHLRKEDAESKLDAADQRDQIGGEIKGNLEAAKYYFDKAQSFSPTDPSYKTYMTKAKQYNDEAKAQADDNGFDFEEMHNSGITQAVNKYAEEQSKPEGRNFRSELEANPKGAYDFEKTVEKSIPLSAGDKEVLGNVKSFMREEGTDYKDALKSVATGLVNGNKLHGDWYPEKEKSLLKIAKAVGMDEEVKSYVKTMAKGYDFGYSEDAAPRVLTGDCKIRIKRETKDGTYTPESINAPREKLEKKLTGDCKVRVRKA